jgi:hypothetical protein
MMQWYRDIKNILKGEPETWLAYLYGQQLHNRPMFTKEKPRHRGFVIQIAKYGALVLRDLRLRQRPELKKSAKFFVVANTANQMRSLDQTIDSLQRQGEEVISIGDRRLLTGKDRDKGYIPCQLTFADAVRSLMLFSARSLGLYRALRSKHPVSVDWYFANFCRAYIYLPYFYRVLMQVKPEFVITANDHNVHNRCMLAVAHYLGIKTVYLQHASVSPIFPALRVGYAFLDGQCALDIYRECEPNQPDTARDVPLPKVILSGQKKHLKRPINRNKSIVGVALNALDNPKAGIEFINALADHGLNVCLRWHPAQADKDASQYRESFAGATRITLSDPRQEPVADFMERIGWLISGNCSIHLEAALAGVIPIYYELTPAEQPDYYGYVRHSLAQPAETIAEVVELIKRARDNHTPNAEAVRYYSSTYLTKWENREGELVAECLLELSDRKALSVEVVSL